MSDTAGAAVTFRAEQRVGRLVLDRSERANRVNVAMMRAFIDALGQAHRSGVDVLVLSSAGPDFCVGRDQRERPSGMTKRDNLALILEANELLTGFEGVTVAAVRGRALGFGSGVATQCDVTVASDGASFGFTEIKDGFAPLIVMTYLERYVPRKVALDLLLTGRAVGAPEAQSMGLVSTVVPDEQLDAVVESVVAGLLDRPADALRRCKSFLGDVAAVPEDQRGALALDGLAGGAR